MGRVIRYVSQEKKTMDETGRRYLSGINCTPELALKSFLATKNLYGKANGTFFYQYVQSFSPQEEVTPGEAHQIAQELAEQFFPGCEVLVATHKQYVRNPDGSLELSRPKTENSVRLVSIPQTAVDLLIQEHSKHPDSPYMFPSPLTGEMYHPDSVVNLHKKILKDAGLEHLRFHDLRHTFATTALQNGIDVKTVSSMLGHFDAGFTLRTYTHATRQKQDEAATAMGSFMEQVR